MSDGQNRSPPGSFAPLMGEGKSKSFGRMVEPETSRSHDFPVFFDYEMAISDCPDRTYVLKRSCAVLHRESKDFGDPLLKVGELVSRARFGSVGLPG